MGKPRGKLKTAVSTDTARVKVSTDAVRQPHVFGHDRHPLGMDGGKIGLLEKANQVIFRCCLKGQNCRSLEAEISLVVLGDLAHKPLERQLAEQKLRGLLVPAYFTQRDSAWSVSVWLLKTTTGRRRHARGLGGELFAGRFPPSRFSRCLLGSRHQ